MPTRIEPPGDRSRPRLVQAAAFLIVAVGTAAIYTSSQGEAPVYLHHDEVNIGLNAHAIAHTGRDHANGRAFPLYFELSPGVWYHPLVVYVTAVFLSVLPVAEWAVRLPTTVVGLFTIGLMYVAGRDLLGGRLPGALCAVLLALTPAYFIHSRIAMDYAYPIPFVLGWLYFLFRFLGTGRRWRLVAATSCLGVGFYSYLASVVMMPVYGVVTAGVLLKERRLNLANAGLAIVGFAWPLLPLIPWLAAHPDMLGQTLRRYQVQQSLDAVILDSVQTVLSHGRMMELTHLYYSYFDPSYFFYSGGAFLVTSTRAAGVFVPAFAILLLAGLHRVVLPPLTTLHAVVLVGFVTSPLAAVMAKEPYAIDRQLGLLPFAALLGALGAVHLWKSHWVGKAVTLAALALIPYQFHAFHRDYYTDYRDRSSRWFNGNVREALETAIAAAGAAPDVAVYLDRSIPYVDRYWEWYVLKHGQDGLGRRTVYLDGEVLTGVTGPGVIVTRVESRIPGQLAQAGVEPLALIQEPNGQPSFLVFEAPARP
ncbi:MAG: ArnT family glycosyltransferase [Acidobacteriota bacterium]